MSNHPVILQRAFNAVGDAALSGAKLNFFVEATSTLKSVFSDVGLTSAHPNPLVADANGRFPRYFMTPNEGYKVRLDNSADVLQWEEDNVFADEKSKTG